jgi:hypothetical protein
MGNSTFQQDKLQLTQKNTLEDNYDSTWERLPSDLFRSVASHLNLKRDIVPLLCVNKKMTIKVLRELCYVTGYYPDRNALDGSYPSFILTCRVSPFYLRLRSISYKSSSLWRIVKNPCPIHRLIINLNYKLVSLEPLSTLWDLSNLYRLVIKMSKRLFRINPS